MKKILIIDDDRDLADLTSVVLKNAGYDVLVSYDPREGFGTAKQQKPDLILLDILLPGMDGPEAVKFFKEDPLIKDIPVIFLTALLSGETESSREEELLIDGKKYPVIAKPFEINDLLERIKTTLERAAV
jgi:DNA-binding response OmpR family regulator